MIELDGARLSLSATDEKGYTLHISEPSEGRETNLKTEALVLRQIASGLITIDKAIANNKVFICGEFKDVLSIYKLAILLMGDGRFCILCECCGPSFYLLGKEINRRCHLARLKIRKRGMAVM